MEHPVLLLYHTGLVVNIRGLLQSRIQHGDKGVPYFPSYTWREDHM